MASPFTPTVAGFLVFVRDFMGIPANALPDDSPWIEWAYTGSFYTVNRQLECVPGPIYRDCVYNLAGHNLVTWAADQPGVKYPAGNAKGLLYFEFLRKKWDLDGWVPGAVQSTSDESTASSYVVPEQLKELTIANLQQLRTPWGRNYAGMAQSVGALWGLT